MTSFAVTWDYRCPFARTMHEHVLTGLAGGADWNVRFVPFSLGQVHVAEGEPDVWDNPLADSGLRALQVGVAVRDQAPEQFRATHNALFAARHDQGTDLRVDDHLTAILTEQGVDPKPIWDSVEAGSALATIRKEHEEVAASHQVWRPTFLLGQEAAFVRVMRRPDGDEGFAQQTVRRVLGLLSDAPELNEFKHTSIPR